MNVECFLGPSHGEALVADLLTWTDLGDGDVPLPRGGDTNLDQTQLSAVNNLAKCLSKFLVVGN